MCGRSGQPAARPEDRFWPDEGPAGRKHRRHHQLAQPAPLGGGLVAGFLSPSHRPEGPVGKGRLPHGQASVGRLRTRYPHQPGHRPHWRRRRSRTGAGRVRRRTPDSSLRGTMRRYLPSSPRSGETLRDPAGSHAIGYRLHILLRVLRLGCISSATNTTRQESAGQRGPHGRRSPVAGRRSPVAGRRDSTGHRQGRPRAISRNH